MKKHVLRFVVALLVVMSVASNAFSAPAEEVMEKVIQNICGPEGKMVAASGDMTFSREFKIRVARMCGEKNPDIKTPELFQAELQSPGEGKDAFLYRVVDVNRPQASFFDGKENKVRKLAWVPDDGVRQSHIPFQLLIMVKTLSNFTYQMVSENDKAMIIEGVAKDAKSLYHRVKLEVETKDNDAFVINEARFYFYGVDEKEEEVHQTLSEYAEVQGAPGYWAADKVRTVSTVESGETILSFDGWEAITPPQWALDLDVMVTDRKTIPILTVKRVAVR